MKNRYALLQRKLEDLESQVLIDQVFSPLESPSRLLLSDPGGIEKQFVFLKNLLSAEYAAAHPVRPHHLDHIAARLEKLETAYRHPDGFRDSAPDSIDTGSVCSCTESCLNEEEGFSDSASPGFEDHEVFYEVPVEEKAAAEEEAGPDAVAEAESGARVRAWREYWGVMARGMVVGVVLMGLAVRVGFSGCNFQCYYGQGEYFPTPT